MPPQNNTMHFVCNKYAKTYVVSFVSPETQINRGSIRFFYQSDVCAGDMSRTSCDMSRTSCDMSRTSCDMSRTSCEIRGYGFHLSICVGLWGYEMRGVLHWHGSCLILASSVGKRFEENAARRV